MSGLEYLGKVGRGVTELRLLRYVDDDLFDDVPDGNLVAAYRGLRSAAHSSRIAADKIRAIVEKRHADDPDFDFDLLNPAPKDPRQ